MKTEKMSTITDAGFEVTINGVTYKPIPMKEATEQELREMEMLRVMKQMAALRFGKKIYTRTLPENVNIVDEFELIQNKKSNLSKWERDEVVRIFNSRFEKA